MFSQYLRLNLPVSATDIDVIRKARQMLKLNARRDRCVRTQRHAFYRDLIEHHAKAQNLANLF